MNLQTSAAMPPTSVEQRSCFQDGGAFFLSKHCAGAYPAHAIFVQAAGASGSMREQ